MQNDVYTMSSVQVNYCEAYVYAATILPPVSCQVNVYTQLITWASGHDGLTLLCMVASRVM